VAHVHSTYSDGTATVPELLEAARDAGAGAVLLADHDTLGARRDGWDGMHAGVLLLVGAEVSPEGGHYLALGIDQEIPRVGRTPREIVAAVRAAGGVGFAAHPFSEGGGCSCRRSPAGSSYRTGGRRSTIPTGATASSCGA
jgi:predicted metal-dependent phosphoesterase TrpH